MTCPQRNHHLLLIYCLIVLLHVQQTVNSLQNGRHNQHPAETHNRYGHNSLSHKHSRKGVGLETDDLGRRELVVNGLREREREHHFRHQHNRQLHRHPQQGSSVNLLRNEGVHHPHSGSPAPHKSVHRFPGLRIEEAVHAFRVSSTTERPVPVALHELNVHHHHQRHNQPLQNHQSQHHSTRQHTHHRIHDQTSRLHDEKMSLTWPGNHHQRSSVASYDSTTGSPLILQTEPPSAHHDSFKGAAHGPESRTASHGNHAKHPDATNDDYDDDDEYYYYEEDNDNEDENENDEKDGNDDNGDTENDDEHVNEDFLGLKMGTAVRYTDVVANGLEYMPSRSAAGVSASEDMIHNDEMDYTEHDVLGDDPNHGLGSFTEQKMRNYSTREGVEKMARAENPNIAAAAHLKRIKEEGLCRIPHPKVIPISNNTSKRFFPHCTVLHRCGDDTGCCLVDTKTCVANNTESVEIYFYVIPMGQERYVIESLTFINHTDCHCVDRNQVRTTTKPSMYDVTPRSLRASSQCVKYFDLDESHGYDRCDCIDRTAERREACLRLSRGEEGFLLEDQRCITQDRCIPPSCEYGQYNKTIGRCPSKDHKIEAAKHFNQPFH